MFGSFNQIRRSLLSLPTGDLVFVAIVALCALVAGCIALYIGLGALRESRRIKRERRERRKARLAQRAALQTDRK